MPRVPLRRAVACLLSAALVLQGLPLSAAVAVSAARIPRAFSPVAPLSVGFGPSVQAPGTGPSLMLPPSLGALPAPGLAPSVRVEASPGTPASLAAPRAPLRAAPERAPAEGALPVRLPPTAALPRSILRRGSRAPEVAASQPVASHAVLPPARPDGRRSAAEMVDGVWRHAVSRGFARVAGTSAEIRGRPAIPSPRSLETPPASSGTRETEPPAPTPSAARSARGIVASVFGAELWLETGAFIIPFVAQSLTGSFLSMAAVSAASVAALALGSVVGGPAIDRFGIRPVYVTGLILRAAAATALFALFIGGSLTPPLLAILFATDYLFTGANRVAEASAPTLLYGGDLKMVNRFGAWKQRAIEVVGIAGPVLIGQMISAAGFGSALAVFGGVLALAALIAAWTVRPPPVARVTTSGRYQAAFRELRRNPTLRWAAAAFGLSLAVTYWLYLLVGQAFSLYAAASPEAAAGVMGWLTGLFCVGGLVGTWLCERLGRRLSGDRTAFIRSTRIWAVAAGLSLLGLWAMLLPGTLPACLAMLPLGVAFGGTQVQSETLIKTEAPEELRGTILGLVSALSFLAIALSFLPMGWMFDAWSAAAAGGLQPTFAAFAALSSFVTALAASFLGFSSGTLSVKK